MGEEMHSEAEDFHLYRRSILDFFDQFDNDADGVLDLIELQNSFQEPVMKSFLTHIGYHKHEAETLFRAMDKATGGKVATETFVDACLRLGRHAKGLGMMLMMDQLQAVQETLRRMEKTNSKLPQRSRSSVDDVLRTCKC